MDKRAFLQHLDEAWKRWHGTYTAKMNSTTMLGDRSVKDIIAHVTWAVLETNGMLAAKALVGSELWRLPEDERNEIVYHENKDRGFDEIVAEAEAAHNALVGLVKNMSEDVLQNADWFAALPGEFPPNRVIQVNVIDHYLHHTQELFSLEG